MSDKRPFFPPSSRVLVGVAMLVTSLGLTYAFSRTIEGPIQDLDWVTTHRSPGDSAIYASAAYHAAYASQSFQDRWKVTGYMTIGTVVAVFGGALALSGFVGTRRS
jgi:hypothetical protein